MEWRDTNDEMTMSIQEDGEFVGCTTMMPIDEPIIQDLIYDRLRERDIPNKAIRKWTDPKLSVYIASITTIPTEDEDLELDRERGSFLLRHTIKWGIMLSHQYDTKNWYAVGTTPTGQKTLEHLEFQEVVSLENGERKGYTLRNFLKSRVIQQFLEEMEQKDLILSDHRTQFMIATHNDIYEGGNKRLGYPILPFTPNSQVECIVMGMATTPEALPTQRAFYGRRLISGVARFLRELAGQDTIITKLCATSSTPTGIAILEDAQFQQIGQIGKRVAFEFDMMTSNTPLAIKYREAIDKNS